MKKSKKGLTRLDILIGDKLHTCVAQRIQENAVDYCDSKPDYRKMIVEMVEKIEDERLLKYFYIFMSEKLKRAL